MKLPGAIVRIGGYNMIHLLRSQNNDTGWGESLCGKKSRVWSETSLVYGDDVCAGCWIGEKARNGTDRPVTG